METTLMNLEWVTPKENITHAYKIGIDNNRKRRTSLFNIHSVKSYCFNQLLQCMNLSFNIQLLVLVKRKLGGHRFMYGDAQYNDKVQPLNGEKWGVYFIGKQG